MSENKLHDRTRIICTIGPASGSLETIRLMVKEGMNVARLNFSHGSHDNHLEVIKRINQVREETGKNIGILQDLGGPKIRTGDLPEKGVSLEEGSIVHLVPGNKYDPNCRPITIPIGYTALLDDIPEGAKILLDDGFIELVVEQRDNRHLACKVADGGVLLSGKGVNFPDCRLSGSAPTEKDIEDLKFGLANGVDFAAISFVQGAEDITRLREVIDSEGGNVDVIAKIERGLALENLDSIIEASDGLMVARGDLGIETDITMVPVHQKQMTHLANQKGVFVIVATQMLESMMRNPMPTRAEVTDVANAIHDGADAIMLSGETAVGRYPVETVKCMRRVADNVEDRLEDRTWMRNERSRKFDSEDEAIARSACLAAVKLDASLIVAQTISGETARLISRSRPPVPIVAATPDKNVFYKLSLWWGIEAMLMPGAEKDFLETVKKCDRQLVEKGFAKQGDLVVISASIPAGTPGGTNVMKTHRVGKL